MIRRLSRQTHTNLPSKQNKILGNLPLLFFFFIAFHRLPTSVPITQLLVSLVCPTSLSVPPPCLSISHPSSRLPQRFSRTFRPIYTPHLTFSPLFLSTLPSCGFIEDSGEVFFSLTPYFLPSGPPVAPFIFPRTRSQSLFKHPPSHLLSPASSAT